MRTTLDTRNLQQDVLFMLVDHFNYSVKDINSYDELTDEEKRIRDAVSYLLGLI